MENPDHQNAANNVPMAGPDSLPTEVIWKIMEELAKQVKSQFSPILYRLVRKEGEPGGLRVDRLVNLLYIPRYREIRSLWSINHEIQSICKAKFFRPIFIYCTVRNTRMWEWLCPDIDHFQPHVRNSWGVLRFTNLLTPPLHEVLHGVENIRLQSSARFTNERGGFEKDPRALLSLPNLRKISIDVGKEDDTLYMFPPEGFSWPPVDDEVQPIDEDTHPGLAGWELN